MADGRWEVADDFSNLSYALKAGKPLTSSALSPLTSGLWPLASPGRIDGWASRPMLGAIPTVLVVKDLVSPWPSLELHHEDCLHPRALTGG